MTDAEQISTEKQISNEFRRFVDGNPDISGQQLSKFESDIARQFNLSRKGTAQSVA